MKSEICVICGKRLTVFGHDAKPVANGRCCNECNHKIIIPARLRARMASKPEAALVHFVKTENLDVMLDAAIADKDQMSKETRQTLAHDLGVMIKRLSRALKKFTD
jgi:hypothetical protein